MKYLLPIIFGFVLTACATATPEANLYVACKSVSNAELALRPYEPIMSDAEKRFVAQIVSQAAPLCTGDAKDPGDAVETVRAILREMVRQQALMEARNGES